MPQFKQGAKQLGYTYTRHYQGNRIWALMQGSRPDQNGRGQNASKGVTLYLAFDQHVSYMY